MTPSEQTAFEAYITDVLAYYRQDVSDFLLDVWWAGCRQYQLVDVKRAITAHIRDPKDGKFPPKLADVTRQLGEASTDRAVLAWSGVLQAASAVGAYRDVDFGDLAVHQAIADLGGWPLLCRTEVSELRHLQHRFSQAYQVYATRGVPAHAPTSLLGDRGADDTWRVRGMNAPEPVRIELASTPPQLPQSPDVPKLEG
jgi:hypothetical protein